MHRNGCVAYGAATFETDPFHPRAPHAYTRRGPSHSVFLKTYQRACSWFQKRVRTRRKVADAAQMDPLGHTIRTIG
jgi:hypothetical protein